MDKILDYNIANSTLGKYYCSNCNHIGEWKDYYNPNLFRCEKCDYNGNYSKVKAKKKTKCGLYGHDSNVFNIRTEGNDILIERTDRSIEFLNGGNEIKRLENKRVFIFDKKTANFKNEKGKEVSFRSVLDGIDFNNYVANRLIEEYNNQNKFKFKLTVSWGIELDSFISFVRNNNLQAAMEDIPKSFFESADSWGAMNKSGTNTEEVLGLPKNICKLIKSFCGEHGEHEGKQLYVQIAGIKNTNENVNYDKLANIIKELDKVSIVYGEQINKQHERYYNFNAASFGYTNTCLKKVYYLVNDLKYDLKRLSQYLCDSYDYQGLTVVELLENLYDYAYMSKEMGGDFDKYPRSIMLNHNIAKKNFKYIENEVDNKNIQKFSKLNEDLKYSDSNYAIVLPQSTKDFIREASILNHCVDSYIRRVSKGESFIAFLRSTEDLDRPLGTIEISYGKISQRRRMNNMPLLKKEADFVKKWALLKGLCG